MNIVSLSRYLSLLISVSSSLYFSESRSCTYFIKLPPSTLYFLTLLWFVCVCVFLIIVGSTCKHSWLFTIEFVTYNFAKITCIGSNNFFFLDSWDFPCIYWCHLLIKTVLFLSFRYVFFLLIFFFMYWLGPSNAMLNRREKWLSLPCSQS